MTREAPPDRDAMRSCALGDGAAAAAASPAALPRVRFVADLVCPWCYVGFSRLMRLAGRAPLRFVWHPFLLNPHLPPEGVPRALYIERKFGAAPGGGDSVHRRAAAAAAAEGLEVRLERIRRQPSTVAAHAMLLAAGERAAPLARALFEAFFRDGRDLGSEAVLAAVGGPLGLAPTGAGTARARDEVLAAHDAACRSGVDGVPVFLFGEDHAIAGAQPEACLEALANLERYRLSRPPPATAAQGRQAS